MNNIKYNRNRQTDGTVHIHVQCSCECAMFLRYTYSLYSQADCLYIHVQYMSF